MNGEALNCTFYYWLLFISYDFLSYYIWSFPVPFILLIRCIYHGWCTHFFPIHCSSFLYASLNQSSNYSLKYPIICRYFFQFFFLYLFDSIPWIFLWFLTSFIYNFSLLSIYCKPLIYRVIKNLYNKQIYLDYKIPCINTFRSISCLLFLRVIFLKYCKFFFLFQLLKTVRTSLSLFRKFAEDQ